MAAEQRFKTDIANNLYLFDSNRFLPTPRVLALVVASDLQETKTTRWCSLPKRLNIEENSLDYHVYWIIYDVHQIRLDSISVSHSECLTGRCNGN